MECVQNHNNFHRKNQEMNYLLLLIVIILPRQILNTAYNTVAAQEIFKVGHYQLYSGSLANLSNAQYSASYIQPFIISQPPIITIGIYSFSGSDNTTQAIMLEIYNSAVTTFTLKVSTASTSLIKISYLAINTSDTAFVFTRQVYNSTANNGGFQNYTQLDFPNITKYTPIMNVIGLYIIGTMSNFSLQISLQTDKFVITSWVGSGNLYSYSVNILFVNQQALKQKFSQFHFIYHEIVNANNNLTISANDQVNTFIGLRNIVGGSGTRPLLTFSWTLTNSAGDFSLTFQRPTLFVGQYNFIRIFTGKKQCPSSDPYWEDSSLSNCVAQCSSGSHDISSICTSTATSQTSLLIITIVVVVVVVFSTFVLIILISAIGVYWWKYYRVKPKLHPNRSHRMKIDPSQKMKILDF